MEVDFEDDVICVEEPNLNSACKELLEQKAQKDDPAILDRYECVLRDLEPAISTLATLNDIPVKLPDAVDLLSSIAKGATLHLLSKSAVESYVNCLLALNALAVREQSALVQRWVSYCFRGCLSCKTESGGASRCSPDIFQLAILLRKLVERKHNIPAAAVGTFLRSAIRILENHSVYADKALHEIVEAVSSIGQSNASLLSAAVNEALCNLIQRGRLALDRPLTRNLLEGPPAVLERLLLLHVLQCLRSGPQGTSGDDRLFTRLADCCARSPCIFGRCCSILFTLYSKSSQGSPIKEIILGFMKDVKSKLDSEQWVLLFNEDLQPLIMMLELPCEGLGDSLRRQYSVEISHLTASMLESKVLDAGSLDVILHAYPSWIREYCNL